MTTISSASSANSLSGGRRSQGLADDFDGFLKLLTSQLQHQDPLSPLDATKFTSQLVEFSSVEQAIRTNTKLDQLIASGAAGARSSALGYLGNTVEFDTGLAELGDKGEAAFSYELPVAAKSVELRILDANGETVRVLRGERQAGASTVRWDGADGHGLRQPAGLYRIAVDAVDARGDPLTVTTRRSGEVTGVSGMPDHVRLTVAGAAIPVDAVLSVSRPVHA
jgi:flagellar basal-body rod modification protein FlgD